MDKKTFPRIILEGSKKEASRLIKTGMSLLFRAEVVRDKMGVSRYGKTTPISDHASIRVDLAGDIKIVRIFATAPPPGVSPKPSKEEIEEIYKCPSAFVFYTRTNTVLSETYFVGGGATGITKLWSDTDPYSTLDDLGDRNYIAAYNRKTEKWVIAYIKGGEMQAACNVGYWPPLEKGKSGTCDVITYMGQPDGFASWGYVSPYPSNFAWPDVSASWADQIVGGKYTPYASFMQSDYFCVGGVRVQGPGELIFGVYPRAGTYYVLTMHPLSITTTIVHPITDWVSPDADAGWAAGRFGRFIDKINIWKAAPKKLNKELGDLTMDDWELHETFEYADYSTSPVGTRPKGGWGTIPGVAYINPRGEAFFSIGIDGEGPHNNPYELAEFGSGQTVYWLHLVKIDLVEGELTFLWKEGDPENRPVGYCDGISSSTSTIGNPTLIRTFGGLDKLYTYECEEIDTKVADFNYSQTDAGEVEGYQYYDVEESYYENRSASAVIKCFDRGTDGKGTTVVDSLTVFELVTDVSVSVEGTVCSYSVDRSSMPETPTGSGSVYMVERRVLNHHPKIVGSWTYIEVIEQYNRVTGADGTVTVNYYDFGELKGTKSFARPNQRQYLAIGEEYGWCVEAARIDILAGRPDWYSRAMWNPSTTTPDDPSYARIRWRGLLEDFPPGEVSYTPVPAESDLVDALSAYGWRLLSPPAFSGTDNLTYQETHRGNTFWSMYGVYQPYHIQGNSYTKFIELIHPWNSPKDNSWVGGQFGRPCYTGNVMAWQDWAPYPWKLYEDPYVDRSFPYWYVPYGQAVDDDMLSWPNPGGPPVLNDNNEINWALDGPRQADPIRSEGRYGGAISFYPAADGDDYSYQWVHALPNVAVHRQLPPTAAQKKAGEPGTIPYIWLKKKITVVADTDSQKARVEATPGDPANPYQGSMFHVAAMTKDPDDWPELIDPTDPEAEGEWYIQSNVLTKEEIKALFLSTYRDEKDDPDAMLPADILAIGII